MDPKLKSILNLALHPSTSEGEAAAALNRARAMAAKHGFDALIGQETPSAAPPKVRVEERVIYRQPSHTHSSVLNAKVSVHWQHSFVERLFKDSGSYNCSVEMISCQSRDGRPSAGLEISVRIHGTPSSIAKFDAEINRWFAQMNAKSSSGTTGAGTQQKKEQPHPAPKKAEEPSKKPWYKFW